MSPKSLAAAAGSMRRSIKSIDVVDELDGRVNTNEPQLGLPAALSRCCAGRLDHAQEEVLRGGWRGGIPQEASRQRPVEVLAQRVPGDRIGFEAASHAHWRGRPRFKTLHILQIPEESTRVAMVRTGEARSPRSAQDGAGRRARGGLEVLTVPGTMQAVFQFYGTAPCRERSDCKPRVRQALSLAIDRQQVIEHVMAGKAQMHDPSRHSASPRASASIGGRNGPRRPTVTIRPSPRRSWRRKAIPWLRAQVRQCGAAGTQYMISIGTTIADMWTKIGAKVTIKH